MAGGTPMTRHNPFSESKGTETKTGYNNIKTQHLLEINLKMSVEVPNYLFLNNVRLPIKGNFFNFSCCLLGDFAI